MRLKQGNFEMFNDGILEVVKVEGHSLKQTVRCLFFGDRTIGVNRFYQAKVYGDEIVRMVAVQAPIERKNVVIIRDEVYAISQIQRKFDTHPECYYVTLKKSDINYKDERS